MDMQSRLSDESGGVVAHAQSVDGDGRMMSVHAEGCPPPADDEPARGAWGHCNLGSGFSLRSTSMDQSKSWLSQTQSKIPALGHAS